MREVDVLYNKLNEAEAALRAWRRDCQHKTWKASRGGEGVDFPPELGGAEFICYEAQCCDCDERLGLIMSAPQWVWRCNQQWQIYMRTLGNIDCREKGITHEMKIKLGYDAELAKPLMIRTEFISMIYHPIGFSHDVQKDFFEAWCREGR